MTSLEVAEITVAIAKLSIPPVIAIITYIIKQGYIQKQSVNLEKVKLSNEMERITFLKNKEVQTNMTSEKYSLLMAWQNLNNKAIKTTNGKDTTIEERICLFLNQTQKKVGGNNIHYSQPLGELVSQTLVYSFSPKVHKYVEKLMISTYELVFKNKEYEELTTDEKEKQKYEYDLFKARQRSETMAYVFTIYYFLSLEWQGLESTSTSLDIIGNVYLKDYYFGQDEEIKLVKNKIEEIKKIEGLVG